MEGLAGLGIAANCVQVIDKSIDLIIDIHRAYRSGTGAPALHERIDGTAKELDLASDKLKDVFEGEEDTLISKCSEAAGKLRKILAECQASGRKRDAIIKVLKSRWKQSEIDDLRREVAEWNQALQTRCMAFMTKQMASAATAQGSGEPKDSSMESHANAMKHALWYPEMASRQQQIGRAHDQTFQWIFEDPREKDEPWDNFVSWLLEGSELYWINGKAGSGKSTLMKYINDEPRTLQALEDWAGLTSLVVGRFFFWNSGFEMEKSLEGLFRSLIYQIIEQAPSTVEVMFSAHELSQVKSVVFTDKRNAFWTLERLVAALQRLAASPSPFQSYCFFIDGLDEFDGDHDCLVDALEELTSADHIKICASSRPLPIFNEAFAESFSLKLQDLTADDIRTYINTEMKRIRQGRRFAEKKSSDFRSLVSDTINKASGVFLWVRLVVRSLQAGLRNGDSVEELKGRLDDTPNDLLSLFQKMVNNLDDRYKAQATRMFRMIFAAPGLDTVMATHSPSISILDMLLAEEDHVVFKALVKLPGKTKWSEIAEKTQDFEQRLGTTCCGLLEFSHTKGEYRGEWLEKIEPQVASTIATVPRLLHQSVKEFLTEQTAVSAFAIEPTYDDYERLLAARITAVKNLLRPGMSNKAINDLGDYAFSMARHVEQRTGKTNTRLVDEIWRSCTSCTPTGFWLSPDNMTSKDIVQYACNLGIHENSVNDHSDAFDVLEEIDVVAYAIAFGLYGYASQKLSDNPELARRTDKIPLLHVMMFVDNEEPEKAVELESWQNLLKELLQNGADPNMEFKGTSAWCRRIILQGEDIFMRKLGTIPDDFYLFLEHGADYNQVFEYKGLLGPLSRIDEAPPAPSTPSSLGTDLLLCDEGISSQTDDRATSPSDETYALTLHQASAALNHGEYRERDRSTPQMNDLVKYLEQALLLNEDQPPLGSDDLCMYYVLGKLIASQKDSLMRSEGYDTGPPSANEPDESTIMAFPVWHISLLYWTTECLLQTPEVKKFGNVLKDKRAEVIAPKVSGFIAQRGSIADLKDKEEAKQKLDEAPDENFNMAFKTLKPEEMDTFTAAWHRAFPNYIVAGYPRELHRMLSLVDQRVDWRTVDASLPKEDMPVGLVAAGLLSLLAAGAMPTTGVIIVGKKLDPMTEGCMRMIGAMEVLLKYGNRLEELGGLSGLIGIGGPEEIEKDIGWGESQACSVM